MFGNKESKEELEKRVKADSEKLAQLNAEAKRISDNEKRVQLETERKNKLNAQNRATYHLDVEPQLRVFYLVQYIALNPQLTRVDGKGLVHRITIKELVKAFELEDFLNGLVK